MSLTIKSLPVSYIFFLKIAFAVKSCKRTRSDFLLSNHENNNNDLVPLKEATEITENLLTSYNFEKDEIVSIITEFNEISNQDLYERILKNKISSNDESHKGTFINFDSFASFLLDSFIKKKLEGIQDLQNNLMIFCKSRYDSRVNFQEFTDSVNLFLIR